jgi:hypothetical protein
VEALTIVVPDLGRSVIRLKELPDAVLTQVRIATDRLFTLEVDGLPDDLKRLSLQLVVHERTDSGSVPAYEVRAELADRKARFALPSTGEVWLQVRDVTWGDRVWTFVPSLQAAVPDKPVRFSARPGGR